MIQMRLMPDQTYCRQQIWSTANIIFCFKIVVLDFKYNHKTALYLIFIFSDFMQQDEYIPVFHFPFMTIKPLRIPQILTKRQQPAQKKAQKNPKNLNWGQQATVEMAAININQ